MIIIKENRRQLLLQFELYIYSKYKKKNDGMNLTLRRLSAVLYEAEQKYLNEYGHPVIPCNFIAEKDGVIINAAVELNLKPQDLLKAKLDMDWISIAVQESLDWAINRDWNRSYKQLLCDFKTPAWQKARETDDHIIDKTDMAKDAGASPELLDYIKEQIALDKNLNEMID